ncbi:hypothetical protein ACP70R_007988 [Stipagrostis hirtigluma subsp. patula]
MATRTMYSIACSVCLIMVIISSMLASTYGDETVNSNDGQNREKAEACSNRCKNEARTLGYTRFTSSFRKENDNPDLCCCTFCSPVPPASLK